MPAGRTLPDAVLARFAALFDRPFPSAEYKILSTEALTKLLGASVPEYLGATFLFTVGAQENAGQFDLAWLKKPQFEAVVEVIPAETLTRIFKGTLAAPLDQVRAAAKTDRNPNPALRVHDFNPLIATPYVGLTATEFLAPLPRLVADKASVTAIYHLGYSRLGHTFTSDLGHLIETYAGEHLHLIPGALVTPEHEYTTGKKSVD